MPRKPITKQPNLSQIGQIIEKSDFFQKKWQNKKIFKQSHVFLK
jgi:hypothetical protein